MSAAISNPRCLRLVTASERAAGLSIIRIGGNSLVDAPLLMVNNLIKSFPLGGGLFSKPKARVRAEHIGQVKHAALPARLSKNCTRIELDRH